MGFGPDGLTPKQRGFVKDYLETGNGTQAALNNYDTEDANTAGVIAWDNLRKPKIQAKIQDAAEEAFEQMRLLSKTADSDNVKFSATKDILDRAGFKPVDKKELGGELKLTMSQLLHDLTELDDEIEA